MPQHEAFRQARIKLNRAQAHLDAFLTLTRFDAKEEEWSEFLSDLQGIWNKLVNAKSQGGELMVRVEEVWMIWKHDPLLQYLSEARNSEEHSLTQTTARQDAGIGINPLDPNKPLVIKSFKLDKGVVTINGEDSSNFVVELIPGAVLLAPVLNTKVKKHQNPIPVPVPTSHLGQPLIDTSPHAVGALALAWFAAQLDVLERGSL